MKCTALKVGRLKAGLQSPWSRGGSTLEKRLEFLFNFHHLIKQQDFVKLGRDNGVHACTWAWHTFRGACARVIRAIAVHCWVNMSQVTWLCIWHECRSLKRPMIPFWVSFWVMFQHVSRCFNMAWISWYFHGHFPYFNVPISIQKHVVARLWHHRKSRSAAASV